MPHICSGKIAHIAVKSHRDALGSFDIGDVVIVADETVLRVLYREGSLSPDLKLDASYFTSTPLEAKSKPAGRKSTAASKNRMVTESETRTDETEPDDGLDAGETGSAG